MPLDIRLNKLPAGYAENTGRAGDKMIVSLSGFFSSEDGDDLITRLEGFPQEVISLIPSERPILPHMVNSLLVLIRGDKTATVYLNEVIPIMRARIKGGCKKGDPISADQILDVGKITFEGIEIPADVGVVYVFSAGWRRGFFYDFVPLRDDIGQIHEYDVEELIGSLYSYLFFQQRFNISEINWNTFFQQRWFPFAHLNESILRRMILHAKNNWNIDELLPKIVDNVKQLLKKNNPIDKSSPYFAEHANLLDRAIERYLADDHISCASILYPRIEGLMRTFHRTKKHTSEPKAKNLTKVAIEHHQDKRASHSLLLPGRFNNYLNDVYFAQFTPETAPDTGRHSVAHGVARADDFNLKSSTIGFLIIFQLTLFFSDGTKSGSNEVEEGKK